MRTINALQAYRQGRALISSNLVYSGERPVKMERARRIERPTLTLARLCSTPELRPRSKWRRVMAQAGTLGQVAMLEGNINPTAALHNLP